MSDESDRLRAVVVEGLFGSRDYTLELDAARPTILTGSNGTGKSTILRLVNAVARGDMETMAKAPLTGFTLVFANTPSFSLYRNATSHLLSLEWGRHSDVIDVGWNEEIAGLPEWARDAWYEDPENSEEVVMEAARAKGLPFTEYKEIRDRLRDISENSRAITPPAWFEELRTRFSVLFISDQRLIAEPKATTPGVRKTAAAAARRGGAPRDRRRAIEHASADIADRIQLADSRYARVSQEQDRTFPRDVIRAMKQAANVSKKRVDDLVNQVEAQREQLRLVGLLDRADSYEPKFDPEDFEEANVRSVVATIMQANLRKLDVLDDLAQRLTTYKAFLDSRYTPKSVTLNRGQGMRIELASGQSIRPSDLSSGEQQMAVLAYEILFRTEPNTLVIIDEPEISLHVLWQDTLVDDLSKMGLASNLQFLMATHSPVILANHQKLERSLDDLQT